MDTMSRQAQEFSKILVNVGKEIGSYTQSTTLMPAEKSRKYLIAWMGAQLELTKKYKTLTVTEPS
jgi:hypothetical protein